MTKMTGPNCAVMCSLINTQTHTQTHTQTQTQTQATRHTHTHTHTHTHMERRTRRRYARPMPGELLDGAQEGRISYLSGDVPVKCVRLMPVSLTAARGPGTVCAGAQREPAHKSNHLARNNPRKEASPIRRPKVKQSSPAHCAHVKRPTRVQLPALQPINAKFTTGRGTVFLKNSGDRYKRHAARIDMVFVTNALTFTRASADTRVGAMEHPQIPYPRILMDCVASPLREIQPRPRPLQRKIPTKVNSLYRAHFCRGE